MKPLLTRYGIWLLKKIEWMNEWGPMHQALWNSLWHPTFFIPQSPNILFMPFDLIFYFYSHSKSTVGHAPEVPSQMSSFFSAQSLEQATALNRWVWRTLSVFRSQQIFCWNPPYWEFQDFLPCLHSTKLKQHHIMGPPFLVPFIPCQSFLTSLILALSQQGLVPPQEKSFLLVFDCLIYLFWSLMISLRLWRSDPKTILKNTNDLLANIIGCLYLACS